MLLFSGNSSLLYARFSFPANALAEDRPKNLIAGAERAAKSSGDLAEADGRAVVDGDFHDPQLLSRGLDLHLNRPAEIRIAHAKLLKCAKRDRPKWPKIRVPLTKQHAHQETGQFVPEDRLRQQGAGGLGFE